MALFRELSIMNWLRDFPAAAAALSFSSLV